MTGKTWIEPRWLRPAWTCALALLYVLCLRAYFVGFFNDDAFYIIGAKSLLGGSYSELNAPGAPPLVNYLPGFSILLAPLAVIAGNILWPYQLFSTAMTLTALWLFGLFIREELPPAARWPALLTASLNPLTVSLSGTVLSEVPTLLLTIVIFLLARRHWTTRKLAFWAALGALAGFGGLLRPTGSVLVLALGAGLILERRFKEAATAVVCGLCVVAPFLLRNYWLTGRSLMYFVELSDPFKNSSGGGPVALFLNNFSYYANDLFARQLFRWPSVPGRSALVWTTGILSAAAIAFGFRDWGIRGWRKSLLAFLVFYAAVHLAWSKQAGRYLLPVLPFLIAALYRGLCATFKRRNTVFAVWGAAILSLGLAASPLFAILRGSLGPPTPLNSPPEETYAWIRENTPPNAVLAAELDARLYLHTGRQVAHLRSPKGPRALRDWIEANSVNFVVVASNRYTMRTFRGDSPHDPIPASDLSRWLSSSGGYRLVFQSPRDDSQIWRVRD